MTVYDIISGGGGGGGGGVTMCDTDIKFLKRAFKVVVIMTDSE